MTEAQSGPAVTAAIERVRALTCWRGPVDPEPLSGGLSNLSFTVVDGGRKYVARLGEDIACHHVLRDREIMVSRAAAELGISPALVHAEPGAMVFDFIVGETYGGQAVRANLDRVVALVRRVHEALQDHLRGPGYLFWVFHVLRDYAHLLRAGGSRHLDDLPRLEEAAQIFEQALGPTPICGCHSDLLAANFIDDGKKIWLIDWEYGGLGSPYFDLGNIAALSLFERDEEARLLEAYFGQAPDAALWQRFDAMRCAAHLRETMWAMVSEIHMAVPGIDYGAYTAENLAGFEPAYAAYQERYL